MRFRTLALLLLLFPLAPMAVYGQDLIYLSSAAVAEAVAAAEKPSTETLVVDFMNEQSDHAALMIRRSADGEAEMHVVFDDVYVVKEGRAVLRYGGEYDAGRTISEGEYRGGTMEGATEQNLRPGDVVVVPAGMAHQVLVPEGEVFIYHVIKVRRAL